MRAILNKRVKALKLSRVFLTLLIYTFQNVRQSEENNFFTILLAKTKILIFLGRFLYVRSRFFSIPKEKKNVSWPIFWSILSVVFD